MAVLVTGGSKGIGRGIVLRFAAAGAHVLVNYRSDDEAALRTQSEVQARGARCDLIKADLSDPSGLDELVRSAAELVDRIDQMVHCAVWPLRAATLEISRDDFAKAVWINGSSLLALTQGMRPLLSRGSSIFFVTSRGSKVAAPDYIAVGAPKALAESIVRYLAVALAPDGIRVNTVSVSTVLTDAIKSVRPDADAHAARMASRNPSGRNVTPEDVGGTIYTLSSPEMAMMTGREVTVDGGIYISGI